MGQRRPLDSPGTDNTVQGVQNSWRSCPGLAAGLLTLQCWQYLMEKHPLPELILVEV